jgi:amidase/aspartyl-tRNA(Asn)/glutamyl-tRNA(Gln) amidotransferase subunit A
MKDLFDQAGRITRAGSKLLPERFGPAERDSALVECARALGLRLVGRTHLNEFAYGLDGRNAHFGDGVHPTDALRRSGGSSSGSAWAVGAGLIPLAFGSDTGGSIRVPAAWCGVVGVRLEPGHWSQEGAVPLAPTYDAAGWFTSGPGDAATVLKEWIQIDTDRPDRGGAFLAPLADRLGAGVESACRDLAESMGAEGIELGADDLATFCAGGETYGVLSGSEAAREHGDWIDQYPEFYDEAVLERLQKGRSRTSDEIAQALESQHEIRGLFSRWFSQYDWVAMPAVSTVAPQLTEVPDHRDLLCWTAPGSLARLPAVTLPVAVPNGLTVGVQFLYRPHHHHVGLRLLEKAAKLTIDV